MEAEEFAKDHAELAEAQKQVARLERDLRKHRRLDARLVDIIREALVDQPVQITVPKPKPQKKNAVEVAVAHCSDVQLGKVTENYDSQVAADQVQMFAEKIIEITRTRQSAAKITELHLLLGGDMVEGETIFPKQVHLIDQSVLAQAVRTSPRVFAKAIATLLGTFEKIHIAAVPGNHGRPASKHSPTHPETNWDTVVYETLRMFLHGPDESPNAELRRRVTFNIASDCWHSYIRVFDWGLILMHGDQGIISYLGTPIYGINRRTSGWGEVMEAIAEPWDYLFLGHFHVPHGWWVNFRKVLINGTTEKGNQFARAVMASGIHPMQRLVFMNRQHGIISDHEIMLTKRGERLPARTRHTRWGE